MPKKKKKIFLFSDLFSDPVPRCLPGPNSSPKPSRSLGEVCAPSNNSFKVGFYLKAVFPSRNLGLMRISRSRFKQWKNCSFIPRIYVLRSFVNFWVILKFREIKNGVDLM